MTFAALSSVAGCDVTLQRPFVAESALDNAEWLVRPLEEAWVNASGSGLLLERRAAGLAEQRLVLPNPTTLRGENLMHLRTVSGITRGPRFDLEHTLTFLDGLPFPFSPDDLDVIRSREDAAGTLNWIEWTNGAGITCVLALRRLHVGARLIPDYASALDLVMRNCVIGDVEAALAPAGPRIVSFPAPVGISDDVPLRTLSPLAAPGI